MAKHDGVIFRYLILLMNVLQHLKRPLFATILTFFAITFVFKIFLLEHSQILLSDVTSRSKLSSTFPPFANGGHKTVSNITISSSRENKYRVESIRDRLENISDKSTKRYLLDQLGVIENIVSQLKSNVSHSNESINMDFRRRVILVTTWRSGSTFLAELLSSYPATYYHYEPFSGHGVHRLRDTNDSQLASEMMKTLLNCDYQPHIENYKKYYLISRPELMSYNRGLWPKCKIARTWCLSPEFINNLCYMYPFQIMKTVRVGLNATKSILTDPQFSDVKIILLVRDPRGTMASRSHRDWCPKNPDCNDPELLCKDMVDDYWESTDLMMKFPNRLKVVRYEDMTDNVMNTTESIFNFLELPMQPQTYQFLKEHCDPNEWKKAKVVPQVWNTFRDPSLTSDKWKLDLKFPRVNKIQEVCKSAMKLWDYEPIDVAQLNNFVRNAKNFTKSERRRTLLI